MKIMLVNSAEGLGGGVTSTVELVTGLARAGHELEVVCRPDGAIQRRLGSLAGVSFLPLRGGGELHPVALFRLGRTIRRSEPDVIIADVRRDAKQCLIARGGGASPPIVNRFGNPDPLKDVRRYRTVWQRLQAIVTNSHAMMQQLQRLTPWITTIPGHVIHNGKDLDRFRPRPELRAAMRESLSIPGDAYVGCVHGSFSARKRVVELISAAAKLSGRQAVHLLLVGEGPEESALRQLVRERNVTATFTGVRSDIPELLAAADVAVSLSEAEGFSNSVVEAVACGLPVIASSAHSHGEQVIDGVTGRLVPLGDVDSVCSALIEFADPVARRDASEAARRHAEASFGIDRMVAAYTAVLESVVER